MIGWGWPAPIAAIISAVLWANAETLQIEPAGPIVGLVLSVIGTIVWIAKISNDTDKEQITTNKPNLAYTLMSIEKAIEEIGKDNFTMFQAQEYIYITISRKTTNYSFQDIEIQTFNSENNFVTLTNLQTTNHLHKGITK